MLKARIEQDLKAAMLSGDSDVVSTLKMLKSALLYKEVELGVRDTGLTDERTIAVLSKEAKKRQEAATMYDKAGRTDQAAAEASENLIIQKYLPEQMSDEDIEKLVDLAISDAGEVTMQEMGKIIGAVKAQAGQTANGAKIAQFVKQKLTT